MNVQECWNVQHTGPSTLFENSEGTIQLSDLRERSTSYKIIRLFVNTCMIANVLFIRNKLITLIW